MFDSAEGQPVQSTPDYGRTPATGTAPDPSR